MSIEHARAASGLTGTKAQLVDGCVYTWLEGRAGIKQAPSSHVDRLHVQRKKVQGLRFLFYDGHYKWQKMSRKEGGHL